MRSSAMSSRVCFPRSSIRIGCFPMVIIGGLPRDPLKRRLKDGSGNPRRLISYFHVAHDDGKILVTVTVERRTVDLKGRFWGRHASSLGTSQVQNEPEVFVHQP